MAMKLKELKEILEPIDDDDIEVIIRCTWEGDEPSGNAFVLRSVAQDIDHDTAESFVAFDCDQAFDDD